MNHTTPPDYESWFTRTYERHPSDANPALRAVTLAAWEAATAVERERCAGIAGDLGGVLATSTRRAVTTDSLADTAFEVAKRIRGKEAKAA